MASTQGQTILVTGGAGYVGSHTVISLLDAGHRVIIFDNFSNGRQECLDRIQELTGKSVTVYVGDMRNKEDILEVLGKHEDISLVIHFAALKAVGESVEKPLDYYRVNVAGSLNLIEAMVETGVSRLIFSSSATVYGDPIYLPMDEKHPVGNCTSPYATTKSMVEEIMKDTCKVMPAWSGVVLRYFNPVGAHSSGMIGEDPKGIPNNLTPFVAQVAIGMRDELKVFGNDYNTHDGTGVRDYIHITDVANGHLAAVSKCLDTPGFQVYNLGTGKGSSVFDVVKAFEEACGKKIKYSITGRRAGDVAAMCACPKKAEAELGWKAKYTLADMCTDAWAWQTKNPNGFNTEGGPKP
ncbi:hypothetical protein RRG08_002050 [Elysia crispata]|uniref:UDP-glucose 4-epimerase n=1 Tax=Elysia crispata TaxID=231223 RepID=A0AAE1DHQ6_9GAST|nr:hypothetical protein RRG08_002050 [Elysia crispata]